MDTIAAIATPAGVGGIGVIRISGPDAARVLTACTDLCRVPEPRRLVFCRVLSGEERVEEGLAVYFPGPHSYTGEDSAELQVHGGPVNTRLTLQAVLSAGARMAQPGEFTRRAFENGRLDLSQAEAVMDLIDASSRKSALISLDQLDGALGRRIRETRESLLDLLARIEAALDYAEEAFLDLDPDELKSDIRGRIAVLEELLASARTARIYREGVRVTLAGLPNAGKSSLLNALTGQDRAIVTAVPGTTRDTLDSEVEADGVRYLITDTAGLRDTQDPVEKIGVERAKNAIRAGQLTLFLADASQAPDGEAVSLWNGLEEPRLLLASKWDVSVLRLDTLRDAFPGSDPLPVSAKTGEGLKELWDRIAEVCQVRQISGHEAVLTRERHVDCVRRALDSLRQAAQALDDGFPADIAADELRRAWHELGAITGDTVDEDIIDRIFEKFCLGK